MSLTLHRRVAVQGAAWLSGLSTVESLLLGASTSPAQRATHPSSADLTDEFSIAQACRRAGGGGGVAFGAFYRRKPSVGCFDDVCPSGQLVRGRTRFSSSGCLRRAHAEKLTRSDAAYCICSSLPCCISLAPAFFHSVGLSLAFQLSLPLRLARSAQSCHPSGQPLQARCRAASLADLCRLRARLFQHLRDDPGRG